MFSESITETARWQVGITPPPTLFSHVLCTTCRKIPGINTYTAEQPDKEQEVIPTVTSIAVPNPEGDKLTSLERVDVQLDSKSRGTYVFVSSKLQAISNNL